MIFFVRNLYSKLWFTDCRYTNDLGRSLLWSIIMSYVEQFDVKHKRLNEPIKERESYGTHPHFWHGKNGVCFASLFHCASSSSHFPLCAQLCSENAVRELLVSETLLLYFRFYRGRNGQQWATLELLELWVWSEEEDEERCEVLSVGTNKLCNRQQPSVSTSPLPSVVCGDAR